MLFEDTEIKSQSLTNSLTERASDKVTYWAVLDSKKGEKEGGANGEHQNDEEGGVLHMMMGDESWEWKCKELVLSISHPHVEFLVKEAFFLLYPQFNVYPSVITFFNTLYRWSKRDGDFFCKDQNT